ncbi:winged helix-turn-helix domain-containing protein [Thalassotalea euphylliae]|uniref:OmpR/PhoB-type domain-containing protein n=1 Tax=Thalassotalea euphylliae TaxID=1655234 RepID=A0A3E0TXZ2_9GAMM|nr:tetratricopeptide repeat protein [Thalassotalea euphylliae]REL29320.1 hypothetical protein DXX94_00470 [Thalassotalea euphylliae]
MESFQLGNWRVSPRLNQLTLENTEQKLSITPKLMQLLLVLVEHKHQPIGLDALIEKVWPQRVVADSSVYQGIAQLRKVLSADDQHQQYIERISGQGYRIAPDIAIEVYVDESGTLDLTPDSQNTAQHNKNWLLGICTLLVVAALFIAINIQSYSPKREADSSQYFEQFTLASHLLSQQDVAQLEQAKQIYLEVIEQDRKNAEALNGLCNSYRMLAIYGSVTEIERDTLCQPLLEKAFAHAPNNAQVLASVARQHFEQGQTSQAEALFEQSLAINRNDAMTWHWYGRLKRNQNQVTDALAAHQRAFKLAPNDPIVLRGLAYAYLNNRDLTNARKYFERSVVISPYFKHKALYELDFYPLNQSRAANYLNWYRQHQESYVKKYPAHKLSHILFLLSVNQGALAQKIFDRFDDVNSVPQHFLFYVKASLAWYYQKPNEALAYLQQRYQLAPEQNHFVMPYLFALVQLNHAEKALTLFKKHFPEIVALKQVTHENIGQYLLLARLYEATEKRRLYQDAYERLLAFEQESTLSIEQQLLWNALNGDDANNVDLLNKLLNNGWLPDFNDNMFSIERYPTLAGSNNSAKSWLAKLSNIQRCIWQHTQCETN